ncbi:MAG: alginate export family protein [Caulobacteraceae bacterium]|nr:alginate export family protein [Caulobacteraceae bacterium]
MRHMLKTGAACAALLGLGAGSAWAGDAPDLPAAVVAGKSIFDVRTRYENVEQTPLKRGEALTTRIQAGWESADFHGVKVLLEFAGAFHTDSEHYNVAVPGGASLNGRTRYPVINDPSFATLNRAQLSWTPAPFFTLTAGRQRVLIDDQRFIGNVGWRQDEQRFDAVRADFAHGGLKATYLYVFHVDRIFGGRLDWSSDSHLVNVAYEVAPPLRLEGFTYALDFSSHDPRAAAAPNASFTAGARASGKAKAGPLQLAYDATWARQTEYRGRTTPFRLDFWQADLSATYKILTLKGDYEQLDGNGVRGFTTPLATTHGFQGWADAFAASAGNKTHRDGIRDVNVTFVVRPSWKIPGFAHPEALVRYFDFQSERTGAYLGREWDAQLQATIAPKLTLAIKYAGFERAAQVPRGTSAPPASRTKLWLTLEYKL